MTALCDRWIWEEMLSMLISASRSVRATVAGNWLGFAPYAVVVTQTSTHSLHGRDGDHFADDILKCIFINEKFGFWFEFHSSKFVTMGAIDDN